MTGSTPDVYTLDEIARAVGVPAETVRGAVTSGELRPWRESYFAEGDILRLVSTLRSVAVITVPLEGPRGLFIERPANTGGRGRFPLLASVGMHAMLLGVALWLTAGAPQTAPSPVVPEPPRLVFLSLPGIGGGGGGSGARQKKPAARIERESGLKARVSAPPATLTRTASEAATEERPTPAAAPALVEKAPEPLPSRSVVAPIVVTASATKDRTGVVEPAPAQASREGTGTGGRAGGGQGQGLGDGAGSGLGEGSGGGTGGGPYRAGSGIQPPRLLREVKADYTEAARRQRLSGDVVLEIVVTRDGRVGNVTVLHGLGLGLDQQAIAAVRQWQFAPARRLGEPVDVVVEVAVEFKLR